MSRRLISLLVLVAVAPSVADLADVEAALVDDDQCVSDGSHCSLNALQVRTLRDASEKEDDDATESDSKWLTDITVHAKNVLKEKLTPLQLPIVELYKNLTELDKAVNITMEEVENVSGEPVVWNRQSLLQDDEEEEASSSSGRGPKSTSLPPRARYVSKILIYLDKEMKAVWNLYTIVDRKRWGIANVVVSNPYGPNGKPSLAQEEAKEAEEKETPEITNKYEEQLYNDYDLLLKNIKDATTKLSELRVTLANTTKNATEWMKIGS